jgi:tRNA(Ile)-lysidine synthase
MSVRSINELKDIQYEIVHFNHKLRVESDEEVRILIFVAFIYSSSCQEMFVNSLGQQYGLPVHTFHLSESEREKSGFQSRARTWRRKIFQELVSERGIHCLVATAHHADDQIETYFHKILRGVSLSHLQPMVPICGNYIRPLLSVHKDELVSYLQTKNHSWREDLSNQSPNYTRNKIRLNIIPEMVEIAGSNAALYRYKLTSISFNS